MKKIFSFVLILIGLLCAFALAFLIFSFSFDSISFRKLIPALTISAIVLLFFSFHFSKKNTILSAAFFFIVIALVISTGFSVGEKILRSKNYQPGVVADFYASFFNIKDSIFLTNDFIADSSGIMIANPEALAKIGYDSANGYFYNSHGFRSDEFFTNENVDSPRIMFIGDSYTWGATADPITNSFADRVRNAGYKTFNLGIQGADPAQYLAVAAKYIPLLKPHFCFVMFFEGNDIMWYKRDVKPYQPLFFYTNFGGVDAYKPDWIDGCPNETFANADEARNYFVRTFTILKDRGYFTKNCSRTVLGTRFWMRFYNKEYPPRCFAQPEKPVNDFYFTAIDRICKQHNTFFQIFVIPELNSFETDTQKLKDRNPGLYDVFSISLPQLVKEDYHPYPDGHFNNAGHEKYAAHILEFIESH